MLCSQPVSNKPMISTPLIKKDTQNPADCRVVVEGASKDICCFLVQGGAIKGADFLSEKDTGRDCLESEVATILIWIERTA